jgi:hypothetical protein
MCEEKQVGSLRWKSQSNKIYRLVFRFSEDFSISRLLYRFLSQSPRFLFPNHKTHLTKVISFLFAHRDFKNPQVSLDFHQEFFVCFESISKHHKIFNL